MQQHVDAAVTLAYLVDDCRDRFVIREIDGEVIRGAAGVANGVDCGLSGLCPLDGGKLFFYQSRRGTLASRLNAGKEVTFQIFFVSDEALQIRIGRIGRATRSSR